MILSPTQLISYPYPGQKKLYKLPAVPYYFVIQRKYTNRLGPGHGYECPSPESTGQESPSLSFQENAPTDPGVPPLETVSVVQATTAVAGFVFGNASCVGQQDRQII